MTDDMLEERIRVKLRATVPLEVPETLVIRATAIPQTTARARTWPWTRSTRVGRRSFRFASAVAALVMVAVIGALLISRPSERGSVAGPGIPTLPPVTQPSLPPAAASPTTINDGAWVSPNVAWLVDDQNRLRMTTDGGLTWSEPRPLPHDDLRLLTFTDASTGYAMWSPRDVRPVQVDLYLTHDGGMTWSSTPVGTVPSGADDTNSLSVHFSDPLHAVALAGVYSHAVAKPGHAGAGLVAVACAGWSSGDGGTTWAPIPGAPCSDDDLWASPSVGLIIPVADGGPLVSLTTDGGLTWTRGSLPGVTSGDSPSFAVLTLAPDGAPCIVYRVYHAGDLPSAQHPLVAAESRDNGATWQLAYHLDAPAIADLSITVLGPEHWLATGPTEPGTYTPQVPISETADGGRTWVMTGTLGAINGESRRPWLDRLHGMIVGADNSGCARGSGTPCHDSGAWFLTNDGGQTWRGVPF